MTLQMVKVTDVQLDENQLWALVRVMNNHISEYGFERYDYREIVRILVAAIDDLQ